LFYVPDLPAQPVYSDTDIEWISELEASWIEIRDEFLAAQEPAADEQKPYLEASARALGDDWEPLAESLAWGSYHLFKQGVPNDRLIRMFPETLEIMEKIPLVRNTNGQPAELFFSVLQGEQHIPVHFGVANTDVAVHLPLIVTPESAIRVADTVHEWQEGKAFVFDDAFDHESWNRSPQTRVNLLFEAWNPDLSLDERNAIAATFDARRQWANERSLDLLPA
jgi:aspartyl/asparaginyl beta-hydroxylase (cupin superfamily)